MHYPALEANAVKQAIEESGESPETFQDVFKLFASLSNELRVKYMEVNEDQEEQERNHGLAVYITIWHFSMLDALIHEGNEPSLQHIELALNILHRRISNLAGAANDA